MDLELVASDAQEGKKQELKLWLRLLATTKLMSQEIRRRLRTEFGATLPQFDLLAQLYREKDGLRLGELSSRTMVTNGNVTGLVERLEADGHIVRERLEDDKRVTVARLTQQGRTYFEAMAESHEGWIKEMMGEVDPAVLKRLLIELGQVKEAAQRHLSEED
jgi:DNA-binding MarR family transcriptional regulator